MRMQREGVKHFQPLAPTAFNERLAETLLCFVLIDQAHTHAFCSRYDFGPWPLLPGVDCLPIEVHKVSQPHQCMLHLQLLSQMICHLRSNHSLLTGHSALALRKAFMTLTHARSCVLLL